MTTRAVQITDMHLTAGQGSEFHGVDTEQALKKVIAEVKQLKKQPDLVIVTGDLSEDGSAETYQRLGRLFLELDAPVFVLPGNHDNTTEMHSWLNVDNTFFTDMVEMKNWGFIFVNSQVEGHAHGCVTQDGLAEIERNILSLGDRPALVALHHTPSNLCPSSGCRLSNAEEFTALINEHKNVKAVIAGHTHVASEIDVGGHTQFTTPATFALVNHAQLGEAVDHEDFWESHSLDGEKQGYRILDLLADGKIQTEVRWLSSE